MVGGRQSLEAEVGSVDDDLAELADLRVHAERRHQFASFCDDLRAAAPIDEFVDLLERPDRRPPAGSGDEFAPPRRPSDPSSPPAGPSRASSSGVARSMRAWAGVPQSRVHPVDVGRHDEQVGVELTGEQAAGQVLVDHRLDADEVALPITGVHRRDAAAAGADDHRAPFEQPAHRPDLEDPLGPGGRDDPPPVGAIRLDDPALLRGEGLGLGLLVDRPDELRRVGEGRVVRVDLDHREDRGERPLLGQQVARPPARRGSRSSPASRRRGRRADRPRPPCRPRPGGPAGRPADRCRAR